jgi:hypothetical protein
MPAAWESRAYMTTPHAQTGTGGRCDGGIGLLSSQTNQLHRLGVSVVVTLFVLSVFVGPHSPTIRLSIHLCLNPYTYV